MYIYNLYDRYKISHIFEGDFLDDLIKLCQIWLPSCKHFIRKNYSNFNLEIVSTIRWIIWLTTSSARVFSF